MEQLTAPPERTRDSLALLVADYPRALRVGFLVAFGLIFLFSARLLMLRRIEAGPPLPAIPSQASDLPDQLGEWQVVDFKHKILNDEFAPESSLWTVRQGTRQAVVSIDGPYREYHTLNICYQMIGWSTDTQFDYDSSGRWDAPQLNATIVKMSQRDARGLVMFTAVDHLGQLVAPVGSPHGSPLGIGYRHVRNVVQNLELVLGLADRDPTGAEQGGRQLPIYQIQVLYQSDAEISVAEYQQIEALFRAARKAFLDERREAGGGRQEAGGERSAMSDER